jgi:hypothetical protein
VGRPLPHVRQAGQAARVLRRREVQLHRRRRGGLTGVREDDGRRLSRRDLGQQLRRVLLGGRAARAQGLGATPVEVHEGRVSVVVAHPGLPRHAVPGRSDQEGEQHGVRQGLEGPDRPHGRYADRQADDPREGPPGESRAALRQDGEGREVSVRDHEARHVRGSFSIHGFPRSGLRRRCRRSNGGHEPS